MVDMTTFAYRLYNPCDDTYNENISTSIKRERSGCYALRDMP